MMIGSLLRQLHYLGVHRLATETVQLLALLDTDISDITDHFISSMSQVINTDYEDPLSYLTYADALCVSWYFSYVLS